MKPGEQKRVSPRSEAVFAYTKYQRHQRVPGENMARQHLAYLCREGRWADRLHELETVQPFRLPPWSDNDAYAFFYASQKYERGNGTWSTSLTFALPVELSKRDGLTLFTTFLERELSDKAGIYVMHIQDGRNGVPNPHIHVLTSERILDDIDRSPRQFFARYNPQHPDRGGARKDPAMSRIGAPWHFRQRWCEHTNNAYEKAGLSLRIQPEKRAWTLERCLAEEQRLRQEGLELGVERLRLTRELTLSRTMAREREGYGYGF